MKKILLLLSLLVSVFTFAQNKGITYQAVIYSTNGESIPGIHNSNSPMVNKAVCLQFSIVDENTQTEYQEKVSVTTDDYGMVNLVIGNGTQTAGYASSFNAIVWTNAQKYLKVSLDQSGNCSAFEEISNQVLTYVPFALAANSATTVSGVVSIAHGGTNATTLVGAKTNLQLQNVDNTSDLNKPLSTATQITLNTKVDKVTGKELSTNDYTTVEKNKLAAIAGTNTGDQDLSSYATNVALATKVDKVTGKELSTNDYTTVEKIKLAAISGLNTGDQDLSSYATNVSLATKVDKVTGKELSTNDYTTVEKTKLAAITGTNTGDQDLSLYATTNSVALKANAANVTSILATKVDKVTGKELSSNDYTTVDKTKLAAISGVNTGDQDLSLLASTALVALKANTADVTSSLAAKVDIVTGKDLSTNDYTTAEKTKLAAISGVNTGDQDLSLYATNANLALKAPLASPNFTGFMGLNNRAEFGQNIEREQPSLKLIGFSKAGTGVNSFWPSQPYAGGGLEIGDGGAVRLVIYRKSSNSFNISTTGSLHEGIGINADSYDPAYTLDINGTLGVRNSITSMGTITAGSVTYPNVDGTSGQVLATNGAGVAAWTSPSSSSGSNFVDLNSNQTIAGNKNFTGNIGIGTSSNYASSKLHINGNGLVVWGGTGTLLDASGNSHGYTEDVALTVDGKANNDILRLRDSQPNTLLVVDKDGNMGIGNTSPSQKLEVTGNIKTSGKLITGTITLPNTDGISGQVLSTNGTGDVVWSTPSIISTANFVDLTSNQTIAGNKTISGITSVSNSTVSTDTSSGALVVTGGTGIAGNLNVGGNENIIGSLGIGARTTNSSVVLDINSTTKGVLFPRLTLLQRDLIASPVKGLIVLCTDCGSTGSILGEVQMFNGITWQNISGANASSVGSESLPVLGSSFQGGLVGYILAAGDPGYEAGKIKGLVVTATDVAAAAGIRYDAGTALAGINNSGTAIGTGLANTLASYTAYGSVNRSIPKIAMDFSIVENGITYDDWYIPSRDELLKIHSNKALLGSFPSPRGYWSSSLWTNSQAGTIVIFSDTRGYYGGDGTDDGRDRVRLVRSFSVTLETTITANNFNGNATSATNVTGIVAIANGGTGSNTQNFTDLSTNQTISGTKTFSSDLYVSGLRIGGTSNATLLGANALGGPFSTTIGNNASSPSSYSVAIGRNSNAMSSYSLAIGGLSAKASESYSLAIGGNAPEATGVYSTAIGGSLPKASGLQSTALGSSTTASGQNSTALGYGATVSSNNSIQLGNTSITDVKTSGTITGAGFKTSGGTSSQFLKADGSLDSNNYLTSGTVGSNFVNLTTNQNIDGYKIFAKDITINNIQLGNGSFADVSNISIGSNTLMNNLSGLNNIAIGRDAAHQNSTGSSNIIIGDGANYYNESSSDIVAIGFHSLHAEKGVGNVAIGSFSGARGNISDNLTNSTFLGTGTNANDGTIDNATAIGNGAIVEASNTIQLGNTNIINVKTSGALTTGGITYPTLSGTSGQVLTADGNGAANWTNVGVSTNQITDLQSQIAQLQAQIASLNFVNGFFPKVTIGNQVWSSTNLDVTTYRDGSPIPQVTDPTEWANLTTGAWCYMNNDPNNNQPYGKLYNWYAIHDSRGLAPVGYHVATEADFLTLIGATGGDSQSGWTLKEVGSTHWNQNYQNGSTNSTGFTAVGGGLRNGGDGSFIQFNRLSVFHLSDTFTDSNGIYYPHYRVIRADDGAVFMDWMGLVPTNGFSVRFVKD
jgi:uncharacterized protein (TIGR02145 family)